MRIAIFFDQIHYFEHEETSLLEIITLLSYKKMIVFNKRFHTSIKNN